MKLRVAISYPRTLGVRVKRLWLNLVTGDETSVYYIEPKSKISNRTWASKKVKRSRIAERLQTVREIWYFVFFYNKDPVMQIPVAIGKTVTGNFFINGIIKKLKNITKVVAPKRVLSFSGFCKTMRLHPKHASIWRQTRLLSYHTSRILQILPCATSCCSSALNYIYFEKDTNHEMPFDLQLTFISIWWVFLLRSIIKCFQKWIDRLKKCTSVIRPRLSTLKGKNE